MNQAYNVCIRVPAGLKEAVDKDVKETREFNSASQWYLAAIREFLESREKRAKDRSGGGGLTNLSKTKKIARVFPWHKKFSNPCFEVFIELLYRRTVVVVPSLVSGDLFPMIVPEHGPHVLDGIAVLGDVAPSDYRLSLLGT